MPNSLEKVTKTTSNLLGLTELHCFQMEKIEESSEIFPVMVETEIQIGQATIRG